jgi:hypothetical protein
MSTAAHRGESHVQPAAHPRSRSVRAETREHHQHLAEREEEQSGLLLELIREVHTVKWILTWVLVIVPVALIVLVVIGGMTR